MPRSRDHELLRALGERVARARTERGWTQERLAEAIGIEPVTLSRWETGDRALSISALAAIADKLGVGLGDLLDVERNLPFPEHAPEAVEAVRLLDNMDGRRRDLVLRLMRELVVSPVEAPPPSTPAPRRSRSPVRRGR